MNLTIEVALPRANIINANDRLHWRAKAQRTATIRTAAAAQKARHAPHTHMTQATCHITVTPPTKRTYDAQNWQPTAKALVDGICTGHSKTRAPYALLPDDDNDHLRGPYIDPSPDVSNDGLYHFTITFTEETPMTPDSLLPLDDYQHQASTTNTIHPSRQLEYMALELCGEAGEVADIIKRLIRGDYELTDEVRDKLALELGDVLWPLSQMAQALGFSLSTIALANLDKLASRRQRGVLQGHGDMR